MLDGCRVVELSTDVAGAFAGRLLRAYGADVVVVEPPGGHPIRHLPPHAGDGPDAGVLAAYLHAGKRSVALDLDDPADRATLDALLARAEIVIDSHAPGALAARGIDLDALADARASLVVCRITPFGQTGPHTQWRATALTAAAAGGQMGMCGDPDLPPLKTAGHQAYYQAGLHAFGATAAALFAARRTGIGDVLDISIQEVQVATLEGAGPNALTRGSEAGPNGNQTFAQWGIHACADGYVGVAAMPRQTGAVYDVHRPPGVQGRPRRRERLVGRGQRADVGAAAGMGEHARGARDLRGGREVPRADDVDPDAARVARMAGARRDGLLALGRSPRARPPPAARGADRVRRRSRRARARPARRRAHRGHARGARGGGRAPRRHAGGPGRHSGACAPLRRHPCDRRHADLGGSLCDAPPRRHGRRCDQDRGTRVPRRHPHDGRRDERARHQPQRLLQRVQPQQARHHARPSATRGHRGDQAPARRRRRVRRELEQRRRRAAGARIRGPARPQPAADLRVDAGVRPPRQRRGACRLRAVDRADGRPRGAAGLPRRPATPQRHLVRRPGRGRHGGRGGRRGAGRARAHRPRGLRDGPPARRHHRARRRVRDRAGARRAAPRAHRQPRRALRAAQRLPRRRRPGAAVRRPAGQRAARVHESLGGDRGRLRRRVARAARRDRATRGWTTRRTRRPMAAARRRTRSTR